MPGAILVFVMIGGLAALLLSRKGDETARQLPPTPNPRTPRTPPGTPPVVIPTDPGEIGPGPLGPTSPGQPTGSRNYPQTLPDPGPAIGASKEEITGLLPEPFKSQFVWLSENVEAPGALNSAATGFEAAGYKDAADWLRARAQQIVIASAQNGEPNPVLPPVSTTTPAKPAGWPDWLAWPPAPPQGWPLEVPFPIPSPFGALDPTLLTALGVPKTKINLPQGFPPINVGRGPSSKGYPTPTYGPIKSDGSDTLFAIAQRITGSASRWPELVDANPEFERHPALGMIYGPGDVLRLPKSWVAPAQKGRYPAPPMRPHEIATWSKTLATLVKGA